MRIISQNAKHISRTDFLLQPFPEEETKNEYFSPLVNTFSQEVVFLSKQNILRSAAALTVSGIISKTVDFLFRAYYSTKLGSEGMGLFSLVFSFHGLILTVATGGLGVAVSKTVSEQYAKNLRGDIRSTMNIALGSVFVLSSAVILAVCIFSKQISAGFLKEPRTCFSIIYLSPSILFMSLSYCIKGYFYASRKILIPASSEFLEQVVKITFITTLLDKFLPLGLERGCEAVFLGITVGELSSCLYLSLFFAKDSRSMGGFKRQNKVASKLLKIALPAMTTSLAGSFLRMQEDVFIVAGLRKSGLSHPEALSQYGILKGMVMPLIVFPLTLLSSFFTLLVPEISRAGGMSGRTRLTTLISRIYRFTAFGGFLVCIIFVTFAEQLSDWVYSAPQIADSVRIIALLSPIMFFDSMSSGILNGLGKQPILLLLSLSDSTLRLGLIWLLVPSMGTDALFLMIIASNLFTALLSFTSVIRSTHMPFELSGWLLRHLLTAAATYLTFFVLGTILFPGETVVATLTAMLFTTGVYLLYSSLLYKTLRKDLLWLFGRMFLNN